MQKRGHPPPPSHFDVQKRPRVSHCTRQPIHCGDAFSWEPVGRHKAKHKKREGDVACDLQTRQLDLNPQTLARARSSQTSAASSSSSPPTRSPSRRGSVSTGGGRNSFLLVLRHRKSEELRQSRCKFTDACLPRTCPACRRPPLARRH